MERASVRVRDQMEPLEPLDLSKCSTVGQLVGAMSRCSFGARMLGEVAETLTTWITNGQRPVAVFDGNTLKPLHLLLQLMRQKGWIADIVTSQEFAQKERR